MVNLNYDWLVMMSLGGAVISFYHVTPWLGFGTLGYR